jgi:2-C-methyl-D-erythritol 4-phosphate cytidylyltransferase/2-C-methyl-D-erythritol 2,4-cyclodiphosphate synthase
VFVSAIIAAAGRGQRIGGAVPKQFLSLAGRTILERSIIAYLDHPAVDELIVALPAEMVSSPPQYLRASSKPLKVVPGGDRRQDSVLNAFGAIDERCEIVVVHDGARPFVGAELISRIIAAAAEDGAALAALPSRDTVKRATGTAGYPVVAETLPRDTIFLAQTPQAFRRHVLHDALALGASGLEATDESQLAERAGHAVRIVEGEPSNIKITTPEDLSAAETLARRGAPARTGRAGLGYDLHRLVDGRPLILGGVTIPFERGLEGHSDADVLCHAITDALLGAASAGDIGRHFPDSDPRWKGASSLELLKRAVTIVEADGLEVGNVDASVVAERPKLAPYVDTMRANIADVLGVSIDRVSIKAKTNEGVDAIGRGEAMAAHAVALLRTR